MTKNTHGLLSLAVFLGVLCGSVRTREAAAAVNVNINLGPPAIAVAEPAEVMLIPNSRVYFAPYNDTDVFFYNGYWWSPRGKQWYRAKAYNGPWKTVRRTYVPAQVYRVPANYRAVYQKEKHIPYGQLKKQWNDSKQYGKKSGNNGNGHKK